MSAGLPLLRDVLEHLHASPLLSRLRLFGSAAGGKGRTVPRDLDVGLDLDSPCWAPWGSSARSAPSGPPPSRLTTDPAVRDLGDLVAAYPGALDLFVRVAGGLYRPTPDAAWWHAVPVAQAASVWTRLLADGVPLGSVRHLPHVLHPGPTGRGP